MHKPSAVACLAGALAVACLAGLTGCGESRQDAVAVRVGAVQIGKPTVDHWIGVIRRGGAFDGFRGKPAGGTPKQQALVLLISSNWLIGEAARRGLAATRHSVDQALTEREQEPGFRKRLEATGETVDDVKLEIRAELADEALSEALANRTVAITQAQVADFYGKHAREFRTPEKRVVDLLEHQPTPAVATAVARRLIAEGRRMPYHEVVWDVPLVLPTPGQYALVDAIFATRPGVLSRPVRFNHHWVVFLVKSKVPSTPQSLASARAEVLSRLRDIRRHEFAAQFDAQYRRFWTARTRCRADYVAPGCPQSGGRLGAYEDPFSSQARSVRPGRT